MRVGVIQSCYVPWRGYFDFIASVDVFVIYDDVQYSSGSWRNRNQVKTNNGLQWLTVPVKYHFGDPIDAVAIGQPKGVPWQEKHRQLLTAALGATPHFAAAMSLWEEAISHNDSMLTALNQRLIMQICGYLGIRTKIVQSREYVPSGSKTVRLLDLLKKLKATTYVSGPAAKDYLDKKLFAENSIGLEYKSYDYAPYPQLWGDFASAVTVLDLIANCGPRSKALLQSRTPNEIVIPSPPMNWGT